MPWLRSRVLTTHTLTCHRPGCDQDVLSWKSVSVSYILGLVGSSRSHRWHSLLVSLQKHPGTSAQVLLVRVALREMCIQSSRLRKKNQRMNVLKSSRTPSSPVLCRYCTNLFFRISSNWWVILISMIKLHHPWPSKLGYLFCLFEGVIC